MIEILPESRSNLLAIKGIERLTAGDYKFVLIPLLKVMMKYDQKIRLIFYMDPDFRGWNFKAAGIYANFGMHHRRDFDKVAGVCGPRWVSWIIRLQSLFSASEIRTFTCGEALLARKWINS